MLRKDILKPFSLGRSSASEEEIANFTRLAEEWWRPDGKIANISGNWGNSFDWTHAVAGLSLVHDSLRAPEIAAPWSVRVGRHGYHRLLTVRANIDLHYFWEKRWFLIALAIGAALLYAPQPEGLTRDGMIVLTMSVVATILFITEPVPLPTVALLLIVGEVILLGRDSTDVARSLMTDSVLFIMGSLMLAVAIVRQKLAQRIAWFIVRMTGTKTSRICFGISVVSGLLASFSGEVMHALAILRSQRAERDADGKHHGRDRVLADE